MATGLIEIMKQASLNAIDNAQMTDLRYGTVVSTNPLKVRITPEFTLPSALLVVPKHLTDYDIPMIVDGEEKTVKILNSLTLNDKVALLRKQGGQSYFILDRIWGD